MTNDREKELKSCLAAATGILEVGYALSHSETTLKVLARIYDAVPALRHEYHDLSDKHIAICAECAWEVKLAHRD